jgi:hypothetical protein
MEYEYKDEYPNSRVLKFEANLLPPVLRPLGSLVGRWAITDDADQAQEVRTSDKHDLEELDFKVGKVYGEISDWLADEKNIELYLSFSGRNEFNDTYDALTALTSVCDLADMRLKREFNI